MYLRPRTIDEAMVMLTETGGRIVAGGTDVLPALVDRPPPPILIDISRVAGLRGISRCDDAVRIGGCTTWTDLASASLDPAFHGLQLAAREVGSVQIQNVATIAGNLCNASPAADGVPPLLALEAQVELASLAGTRVMPLAAFIEGNRRTALSDNEILVALRVPPPRPMTCSTFLKLGARRYLVISIAMVAAVIRRGGDGRIAAARVAVGSCSAVAQRLRSLEDELSGQPWASASADIVAPRHVDVLTPIDDVRASADYRSDAAVTLVRRALAICLAETAYA
jgi:CO/xanthine dehydrogenase FAD-binding subunit